MSFQGTLARVQGKPLSFRGFVSRKAQSLDVERSFWSGTVSNVAKFTQPFLISGLVLWHELIWFLGAMVFGSVQMWCVSLVAIIHSHQVQRFLYIVWLTYFDVAVEIARKCPSEVMGGDA